MKQALMSLGGNEVSNAKNHGFKISILKARVEHCWIDPVVNHSRKAFCFRSGNNFVANMSTHANNPAGGSINHSRYAFAPLAGGTLHLSGGEGVKAVYGDNIGNFEFPAQECGGMPAGQRPMGVDQVNMVRVVLPSYRR